MKLPSRGDLDECEFHNKEPSHHQMSINSNSAFYCYIKSLTKGITLAFSAKCTDLLKVDYKIQEISSVKYLVNSQRSIIKHIILLGQGILTLTSHST